MLQVSFIIAALLAAEGVVLAHPINYVRRDEPPSIVPRAVPDNNQAVALARRSLLEDLYGEIVQSLMEGPKPHSEIVHVSATAVITPAHDVQLGSRGYDVDDVEARGEDEEKMERRELDETLPELMAREYDGGELDARDFDDMVLVPRRNHNRGNHHRAAAALRAASGPPEAMTRDGFGQEETVPGENINPFTSHPVVKEVLAHPWSKAILGHPKVQGVLRHPMVKTVFNNHAVQTAAGHAITQLVGQ